jgi:hypothetical protein
VVVVVVVVVVVRRFSLHLSEAFYCESSFLNKEENRKTNMGSAASTSKGSKFENVSSIVSHSGYLVRKIIIICEIPRLCFFAFMQFVCCCSI